MFPGPLSFASPPSRPLRRRLVRSLDVAVEFATLGEFGVEEVDVEPRAPVSCGWDWPARRPGTVLPRARSHTGAAGVCPA
ncbi:MAG: hypothetical protein WD844_05400 [Thermoleophilaceae bacterium]